MPVEGEPFHDAIPDTWLAAGNAMTYVRGALLIGLCAFARPIHGQVQWIESKAPNYTVFYQAGFESDLAFTRRWMDNAERVMKEKYGVTAQGYLMSVYLYPEPADDITLTQSGQNVCCTSRNGRGVGTLKLLARSAAVWKSGNFKSSLGLPKEGDDYHAKVLMSEYIPIGHYAVQDARPNGGWKYYDAPNWFVQGLQEYDAIMYTTDSNRVATSRRLVDWAKAHKTAFACCAPGIRMTDDYNGGATFMAFLAAVFGEGIHARLLRSPAATFDAALATETGLTPAALFARLQQWLEALP